MTRTYTYDLSGARGNIIRAVLAIGICIGLVVAGNPHPWVSAALLAFAGAFIWFLIRCLLRLRETVELDADGLRVIGKSNVRVLWQNLAGMRLDFFTTRRDRDSGWMTLELKDINGHAIRIDSDLDGFEDVITKATQAASKKDLPLSVSTRANIDAVGGHLR